MKLIFDSGLLALEILVIAICVLLFITGLLTIGELIRYEIKEAKKEKEERARRRNQS